MCKFQECCPIFINICEWQLIDRPKSETAPIPFYCGSIYNVDNGTVFIKRLRVLLAKVTCIAMNPMVFVQYNFSQTSSRPNSDINQLLALMILFIKQEKNIHTMELDEINTQKLVKFDCIWCSEPYGGESEMLKSLHYKKFSLADIPKQLLKLNEDVPTSGDVSTNIDPKIKLSVTESNENSKLIHEVRPNPCWELRKPNKRPNTCEYKITLPIGSNIEKCELDISQVCIGQSLVLFC